MEWIDITRWVAVFLYVVLRIRYFLECKKENPQDYTNKKLLRIEMWIIVILILIALNKISIAIVV